MLLREQMNHDIRSDGKYREFFRRYLLLFVILAEVLIIICALLFW